LQAQYNGKHAIFILQNSSKQKVTYISLQDRLNKKFSGLNI